ncbi:spastin [Gossypium australe]|uniref:Spastin n=1 Tax=Gossypium australe TaxID=47621 RepID=A0A5B6URN7_9ROSI|nr:spastin [Gossypium australe]
MEQKGILLSALSVGVGIGVGLGLASGQTVSKWTGNNTIADDGITGEQIEQELMRQVIDGKLSKVSFDDFPYYLSERTRALLTSTAYVQLKHSDVSRHTRKLSPVSKAILLSGPAELYQQMLAKALAHYFESKLLLLDITDFSLKMQSKYGCTKKEFALKRSISEMTLERMNGLFGSFSLLSPREETNDNRNHIAEVLAANDLECDDLGSICYADTMILGNYIEEIVVSAISYHLMNNKDPEYRNGKLVISSKSLSHGLNIFQEGKSCGKDTLKLETNAESSKEKEGEEAVSAKTEPKSDAPASESKSETEKSLSGVKKDGENPPAAKAPEVPPDNEFEKRIRPEVIPANEIGVTFADIGAMDDIKESLQELVMLPLRRPDLFNGGLLKPCRGILLFGPPGTGKTMLAKAIANEAGASFINVSMSTITSKWFGEDEKNVRALFTLAAKVAPTIIFVDEVDSMLGQRTRVGEHEAMRKIKNEFMTHWDGLLTKAGERVLVLAATNRPFDLDEAIIRRFERRIMVGLPSIESREIILRTLLAKEKVEDLDFKELATMTEGYSGSDLKNLCITAAYRPVRELIKQERLKDQERKRREEASKNSEDASDTKEENEEERVIALRPLNMEDMRQAKNQVAASFASEGSVMAELKQWNDLYGEGGSRKKEQLTYFL